MANSEKSPHILRDFCFLILLIVLVKKASERTITFISLHKNSITHELDRTFIDHLYTAQKQAHQLQELFDMAPTPVQDAHLKKLADIVQKLATIEEKYTTNSAGLTFLGPLGTTAIVLKEQDLEKKLKNTALDLCSLAYAYQHSPLPFNEQETKKLSLTYLGTVTHAALVHKNTQKS
ncbi:MAG TPA: hypothetical protein VEK38_02475 [Candidatus Bathyarchaeia archaeon]|nr:hypothetical protein [Candidatus Bathyarchaeia archaeon]